MFSVEEPEKCEFTTAQRVLATQVSDQLALAYILNDNDARQAKNW
jgi:hypothetical protein